jgi:hypothetical protein
MPTFQEALRFFHFREFVKKVSPPWLAGYNGYRVMYDLGLQVDALAEYLRIGCLQGFPSYCETESLAHIGQDRGIQRGVAEQDNSFRLRLKQAPTTWKRAGSPVVLLPQVAAYFSPADVLVRYVASGYDDQGNSCTDWWSYQSETLTYHRSTPANWDWDTLQGDFRFWLIIYCGVLPLWYWDQTNMYFDRPGLLWGFQNGNVIYDLKNIIEPFKGGGSHLGGLILTDANPVLDWADPLQAPGYPLPDGGWQNPDNRYSVGTQYFFVPGD